MIKVIKRDRSKVDFNERKITQAILKAYNEVYIDRNNTKSALSVSKAVCDKIHSLSDNTIDIEEIQNMVENQLMSSDKEVARAYITYRYKRKLARNEYKELMKAVSEKLSGNNIQNQNANLDEHSFGGRMGETTDLIMKRYSLDYCMSEMSKNNHLNNTVYIHDLSHWAVGDHNCLSIPFDDLLANGFNTRQTDVRPAQSVGTAFQLLAVIFQLQSLQQFGGVSSTHLDWTMIPYVRKSFYKHLKDGLFYMASSDVYKTFNVAFEEIMEDCIVQIENSDWSKYFTEDFEIPQIVYNYTIDMTIKETYQAVEGMYHNLCTLQSRSGNQLPFSSINYGTCTLPEGRLVIKALLDVSIKGIGKLHKTSIFPCGIFQCMKGVNREKGDPNYDLYRLALKSTSLRLYPNYANVDWSGNAGYDKNDPKTYFSTMGKCKCSSYKIF
ncbi:MAG: ATP cone domain-containing protein [Muribaculaceae bacterium]|nr:ATP cone domain-containing protein [Alistipes senegalensis]MCM1478761.1 ATP cone domain-containing protein [Muribaculaceae bacterium]